MAGEMTADEARHLRAIERAARRVLAACHAAPVVYEEAVPQEARIERCIAFTALSDLLTSRRSGGRR